MSSSNLEAALKVFPLSETILVGKPHLAVKRLKYHINDCAVKSGTTFKCIALTTQQEKRYILTFDSFELSDPLTYRGPAKSTPVYIKAGTSLTLNAGSVGGGGG